MNKYKLLALDMDGTLLNSEKKISSKTLQAITELSKSGVNVVLSTGRGLAELNDYKDEFKFLNYGVLISGGLVYDFKNKKSIAEHPLSEKQMLAMLESAKIENAMVHLLTLNESIANDSDIEQMENFQMEIYQNMFRENCRRCDDFEKYIRENVGKILKFNIYHRSSESRLKSFKRLENLDLTFSFVEGTSLEGSPKNISKASGLLELCRFLNIDISETVAVGDAQNDTEILKTVGLAVAMGNASDEIKKIADFVTDDNDHDGIAKIVEKYF